MFCPKCGTENPDDGKFCRSCGVNLGNVKTALSGNLPENETYIDRKGKIRSNNPDDIWSSSIRNFVMGIGFLVISAALFFTGVAGGRAWWWAMLFPAASFLASGFSQMAKVKRLENRMKANLVHPNTSEATQPQNALPPIQTEYLKPSTIYDTGELIERPPSVIEGTTRHLEINKEAETMTLKRDRN